MSARKFDAGKSHELWAAGGMNLNEGQLADFGHLVSGVGLYGALVAGSAA
jgi:hypothetical protein